MADDFDLRDPDMFLAGTVGPPGQRIFFLQASEAGHVITLKLEKGQVWALASVFRELLDDQGYDGPAAPGGDLIEPVAAAWTVGRLATGLDPEGKIIVVIAEEIDDSADDNADEAAEEEADEAGSTEGTRDEDAVDGQRQGGRARFHLDFAMARGFARQALQLVEGGRDFGMRNGHRPPAG